jgi:epoxyqueuosine reductase
VTTPQERSSEIKALAHALGADCVGICAAEATPESRAFGAWLDRGHGGVMKYLERTRSQREDPALLFDGVRSLVVVGLVYHDASGAAPSGQDEGAARASRYARGDDYHDLLADRLRALAAAIEARWSRAFEWRAWVDTGPVLERVAAAYAGLGWVGKNTCLIHPDFGSYLFLGVLATDLDCAFDALLPDQCGTCTACLDACPTGAFTQAHELDATRCIAYTTIEDPGPIPEALREAQGEHVYGCDVCQEVCPWNQRRGLRVPEDPLGLRSRLEARSEWRAPELAWLLDLDEEAWRASTRGSAMRRSKYRGLMRNALVAAGNRCDPSLRAKVERFRDGDDSMLAEHAAWALARLCESDG